MVLYQNVERQALQSKERSNIRKCDKCFWHGLKQKLGCPGAVTFQIQITKTYNTTNLLEDIKGLYKIAGLKGQKVAFIFT